MNAKTTASNSDFSVRSLQDLPRAAPSNDARLARPIDDSDPFTRGYRRFTRQLRAAAVQYVDRNDVDDLIQDVWVVVAQSPARRTENDARTLTWLIGIAKRCAPSYGSRKLRHIALDELLAGEAGDDLEGRAMHEDVGELEAQLWGKDD
jgi:DNA-directed RNA polymerase specialized sigma24 family protein